MNRTARNLALGLILLAGFGLGLLLGVDLAPARAGGIASTSVGDAYVASNEAGDVVYKWYLGASPAPYAERYDFRTGRVTRKVLEPDEGAPAEGERPPATPEEAPEIVITGVIWTPNPAHRVAFINGQTVREGEIFETRSGKRYRVIEIKRTDEVDYREVQD